MGRSGLGLLGLGALCAAAMSASAMGGCQADGNGGSSAGGSGLGGGDTTTTSSSDGGGGSTTSTTTGTGGGGGAGGSLPVVTIQDITSGTVGEAVDVEVHGVVAMSRKYLVSKSKNTGSCLWGVYLSAPGLSETGPNTGILALSYGTPGVTDPQGNIVCPTIEQGSVGDAFPDDVKPGDVLDVRGETSYFLLNACATQPADQNPSQVKQRQLAKVDLVTRTGTAPVPTPHTVTPEELALLNSATDQDFHDMWGGVKVRLPGPVSAVMQTDPDGNPTVVGAYGNIYLDLNSNDTVDLPDLRVGDKIYYINDSVDLCHQAPDYDTADVTWTSIDGFSTIDFCTWAVQPSNKCLDFDPVGVDCMAGLVCP
ncbi:MAG: hypothetical protein IT372_34060 [Polyangiaceae bacterium]|nr:hypothetical protein [Polyangiaceae bacterium]